ncbi:Fic family protein [Collinsella sp. AGMB00827]|uniref:Fic family protein n=1 Tax=Collinsella ureilytica TaxID=2869515 RepID=A0ABS7MI05_9ACTN|nr:Fic family protein [Collinsella urealyticum]MBY4796980.1 Fic family protein [Collinsella urealyticum]
MEYVTVTQMAAKWGLSTRRVRKLCADNSIEGVLREGKKYLIPATAPRPIDRRKLRKQHSSSCFTQLFRSIDEKKIRLDSMRPLTTGELARLREEFLIDFTYNSNTIEGNTLTLQETALVLEGMTIDQKPLKDHLEAIGHKDAFIYVEELAQTKTKIGEREIKEIHALVLMHRPQDKGSYRKIPVRIAGAATTPTHPYEIEASMKRLLRTNEERKKTMHPIERIARFHLEFEGIHPFIDGNGRTGRLLLNLELLQSGYPAISVKFTDRKRYYDAFDAYYRDGQPNAMVELVASYINEQLDRYFEILSL